MMERVDFSEIVTLAARQVTPMVLARFQSFSFDYCGPRITLPTDVTCLRRTLHRLLCGAVDCLQSGFVMFLAEAEAKAKADGDACRVVVTSAGAGHLADAPDIDRVLERLDLESAAASSSSPGARVAFGRCPITGAELEFSCLPDEGVMLRGTLWSTDFEVLDDDVEPPSPLAPMHAWLVGAPSAAADSLTRRLQRLGWAVSRFDSCTHVQVRLAQASSSARKPAWLVAFEFDGATTEAVRRLRDMLPASTRIAYAVASGSAALSNADALPGCEVHVYPFSPDELLDQTQASRGQRLRRTGNTTVASLLFDDRPLALVVDDDEVNRIVACGLLQVLGYETATARNGMEAIDLCRRLTPHAVLMDLDMPVLDGLRATRELRRLQRVGALPPCAIVAATSQSWDSCGTDCQQAGMDGHLTKPLLLPRLRDELRRVTLL